MPVLNVGDLRDGRTPAVDELSAVSLSLEESRRIDRYAVREGDVVITSRGTVTKVALVGVETVGAFATSNLLIVRPKPSLDPRILYCYLQSRSGLHALESLTTGSTVKALSAKSLRGLRVPWMSFEQQRELGELVEVSEEQYHLGLAAARVRRELGLSVVLTCLGAE